jgi:hypothetical protein
MAAVQGGNRGLDRRGGPVLHHPDPGQHRPPGRRFGRDDPHADAQRGTCHRRAPPVSGGSLRDQSSLRGCSRRARDRSPGGSRVSAAGDRHRDRRGGCCSPRYSPPWEARWICRRWTRTTSTSFANPIILLPVLVAMLLGIPLAMAMFFAPSLVALDRVPVLKAFGLSFVRLPEEHPALPDLRSGRHGAGNPRLAAPDARAARCPARPDHRDLYGYRDIFYP